jgi:hypothetical protein
VLFRSSYSVPALAYKIGNLWRPFLLPKEINQPLRSGPLFLVHSFSSGKLPILVRRKTKSIRARFAASSRSDSARRTRNRRYLFRGEFFISHSARLPPTRSRTDLTLGFVNPSSLTQHENSLRHGLPYWTQRFQFISA